MTSTEMPSSFPVARLTGGARTIAATGTYTRIQPYSAGGKSGYIDASRANGEITIRREGFYLITAWVQFATNWNDVRRAALYLNDAQWQNMGQFSQFAGNSVFTVHQTSTFEWFSPGDRLAIWCQANVANNVWDTGKLTAAYMPGYAPLAPV